MTNAPSTAGSKHKRSPRERFRKATRPLLFFLIAAVSGYIVWRAIPIDMITHARRVVIATVDGDVDTLYEYSYDFEKETVGLTRDNLRAVYERLVKPRIQPFNHFVSERTDYGGEGEQGLCVRIHRSPDGLELDLGAAPYRTDDGAGDYILFGLLMQAWRAEYLISKRLPMTQINLHRARLEGLRKDRPILESLGLMGFAHGRDGAPLWTWDEVDAFYSDQLRRAEAGEVEPTRLSAPAAGGG